MEISSISSTKNTASAHQLLGSLVLERGRGDLVLLREKLILVRLLQVKLHVLEGLTLAQVVVVLIG